MIKILVIYFVMINLIGVYIMYSDKHKAKRGQYRVPEATLWRIAFIGGAVGTTAGMKWFRHKTKHTSFKWGFPALAVIQAAILLCILVFH